MLQTAKQAALEAGAFLKESLGTTLTINRKQGEERNLVTQIDKEAEKKIIARIKERYPGHGIMGEESGDSGGASDYKWIIDPLDGTTNFTHGVKTFCVSIGVEHKGELLAGVIYDPNLGEMFHAEKGKGAFLNNVPIRISKTDTLINALLVTGFPYRLKEHGDEIVRHFVNFLQESQGIRRIGSAALDLAYVACGRFDGYWEVFLNPWDMAAGKLIVQEAGGMVTDFAGKPSSIHKPDVLATNGILHQAMLEVLCRA